MTIDPPSAFRPWQPPYLTLQEAAEAAMDFGWGVTVHPKTLPHGGKSWMWAQPWAWSMRRDCEPALALSHHPLTTKAFDLLASGRGGAA